MPEFDFAPYLGLLVAIVALVVATIFNLKRLVKATESQNLATESQNLSTKSQFSTLLKDYTHELTTMLEKEGDLQTQEDCVLYAISYCDTLDSLAFMSLNEKIPLDIARFFNNYYGYAGLVMDWYNEKGRGKGKSSEERWGNIVQWMKTESIEKDPKDKEDDFFPDAILNYDKLPKNNLKI